ncbi:MAG: glycyl-radical enzyme activating protein [Deltaproteobacteria bacterium]|nr:glycyl-radical enzyme activating protein [Deltaproteobacteria bacterium]
MKSAKSEHIPDQDSVVSLSAVVTELKKFATHDGPGIRTTVFLKGCPLQCKWCSNPETMLPHRQLYFIAKRCKQFGECVDVCPAGAISMDMKNKIDRSACTLCMKCVQECPYNAFLQVGMHMSIDDVMKEIEKDIPFYGNDGGLTLSGGEPLYQSDFAIALLKRCREAGISTVLDTSGYASHEIVKDAMDYTDLVLLDIKHMNPEQHRKGTGVNNTLIFENAEIMAKKAKIRISLPLIPGFNDTEKNLIETARFAISLGIDHIDVNPLHTLGNAKYIYLGMDSPYEQYKEIEQQRIELAKSIFEGFDLKVTVGRMM